MRRCVLRTLTPNLPPTAPSGTAATTPATGGTFDDILPSGSRRPGGAKSALEVGTRERFERASDDERFSRRLAPVRSFLPEAEEEHRDPRGHAATRASQDAHRPAVPADLDFDLLGIGLGR
jgi:hypothetical protein